MSEFGEFPDPQERVAQNSAEQTPQEYKEQAVAILKEDLRALYDYIKNAPAAQKVMEIDPAWGQMISDGSPEPMIRTKSSITNNGQPYYHAIAKEMARLVDSAMDSLGYKRAMQITQLARIKVAAAEAQRTKPPK